jgi:hypothetical protein
MFANYAVSGLGVLGFLPCNGLSTLHYQIALRLRPVPGHCFCTCASCAAWHRLFYEPYRFHRLALSDFAQTLA